MAPLQNPMADHFRSNRQSMIIHVRPPTDAARLVTTIAITARKLYRAEMNSQPLVTIALSHKYVLGTEARSTVEAKPTEPEESGTQDDEKGVVRLVCELLSSISTSFTEVKSDGERSSARGNVHGRTSGIVQTTQDETPTCRIPGPAR